MPERMSDIVDRALAAHDTLPAVERDRNRERLLLFMKTLPSIALAAGSDHNAQIAAAAHLADNYQASLSRQS